MSADLFHRFDPQPGNLHIVERRGILTLTKSEAGHHVLWRYNRVVAQGSKETCNAFRN